MIYRIGWLTVLAVTAFKTCGAQRDIDNSILEQFFGQPNSRPIAGRRCDPIGGDLAKAGGTDCYDCYNCGDRDLDGRDPSYIQRLTLNTESCDKSHELCCVRQAPSTTIRRRSGACGRKSAEWEHARVRSKAGEVLTAEYPWTAAVFKRTESGSEEYLCGAALVSPLALVTTARCAGAASADRLVVRLGPSGEDYPTQLPLDRVVIHEGYNRRTGHNDVALLALRKASKVSIPRWAVPVCLPEEPPLPSAPCLTALRGQKTLYSRAMSRSACGALLHQGGLQLHGSHACSVADLQRAPPPEHAAPLVCQDDSSSSAPGEHTLHGLASYMGLLVDGVHLHTSIAHLAPWIRTSMEQLDVA